MTDRSMLRCPCVALVSLLMACGSGSDGASDGADGSGTTNGSGDEGSDAGDDGDDGDGGDGFAPDPDVSGPDVECSTWGQDCNDGDRCIPWNGPNGVGTRCVPIGDQPKQPGEPCILDSDDVDDCDIGATCWGIDPNTEIGTCMEMCTGAPATPQCGNPDNDCVIVDTVRPLCLSPCHPLLQDCTDAWGCYQVVESFFCTPDASGGAGYGTTCGFANSCSPGLMCALGAVPGCDETFSCCTHFCDLSNPDATASCPDVGAGQECVPFYALDQAPPGLQDVGVCAMPPE